MERNNFIIYICVFIIMVIIIMTLINKNDKNNNLLRQLSKEKRYSLNDTIDDLKPIGNSFNCDAADVCDLSKNLNITGTQLNISGGIFSTNWSIDDNGNAIGISGTGTGTGTGTGGGSLTVNGGGTISGQNNGIIDIKANNNTLALSGGQYAVLDDGIVQCYNTNLEVDGYTLIKGNLRVNTINSTGNGYLYLNPDEACIVQVGDGKYFTVWDKSNGNSPAFDVFSNGNTKVYGSLTLGTILEGTSDIQLRNGNYQGDNFLQITDTVYNNSFFIDPTTQFIWCQHGGNVVSTKIRASLEVSGSITSSGVALIRQEKPADGSFIQIYGTGEGALSGGTIQTNGNLGINRWSPSGSISRIYNSASVDDKLNITLADTTNTYWDDKLLVNGRAKIGDNDYGCIRFFTESDGSSIIDCRNVGTDGPFADDLQGYYTSALRIQPNGGQLNVGGQTLLSGPDTTGSISQNKLMVNGRCLFGDNASGSLRTWSSGGNCYLDCRNLGTGGAFADDPTGYSTSNLIIQAAGGSTTIGGNLNITSNGEGFKFSPKDRALWCQGSDGYVDTLEMQPNGGDVYMGGNLRVQSEIAAYSITYIGSIGQTSSKRYKENIKNFDEDFSKILKLDTKIYNKITNNNIEEIGLIAEEVEELGIDKLLIYKDEQVEGIDYTKINLYLLEVVKQQQIKLDDQQKQINQLFSIINNK